MTKIDERLKELNNIIQDAYAEKRELWKEKNIDHNKSFVGKFFKSYEDDGNNHWVYIQPLRLGANGYLIGNWIKVYGDMGRNDIFSFSNSENPVPLDDNYTNDGYMTEISEEEFMAVVDIMREIL